METQEQFEQRISSINREGNPRCRLQAIIGADEMNSTTIEMGDVEFERLYFDGGYLMDLTFRNPAMAKKCINILDRFGKSTEATNHTVDNTHALYFMLTPAEEYWTGFIMGVNPMFWALTSDDPEKYPMTVRVLFSMENIGFQPLADSEDIEL